MILHNCIKCNYFEMIPVADECPVFEKYTCPECKTLQWIKHSRINSETYYPEDIEVDEVNKSIKLKGVEKIK